MKFLFDLFPVLLFFVSFKLAESRAEAAQELATRLSSLFSGGPVTADLAPILLATGLTMIASLGQIGYLLARRIRVDGMLWLSFGIIMVFGGATIYFHSPTFIMWKPTVLYWSFGSVMLFSQYLLGKNLIRAAMEAQIKLPEPVWAKLGLAWIAYFALMGAANLYVAFNFPRDTWANFKLLSAIAIMPIFVIAQSVFLAKYIQEPAA
jgi:intracellular septation protein